MFSMSEKHKDQTLLCVLIFWLYCVLHVCCLDDADEDLDMCGGDPVVSCTSGSVNGEQEVPLGSHVCQESSMHTAEKHRGLYFFSSKQTVQQKKTYFSS